jgi:Rrf2 family iron-sulfur cluster assembly transcriptional regulator
MDVPQTAEYALRALAHLATHEGSVSREELARATRVPSSYLAKVLRKLVDAEILDVKRGPGGGYVLARQPSEIRFVEVLSAMGVATIEGCAFGYARCDEKHPCALHGTWTALKDSIGRWASETTLEDVRVFAKRRLPMARRRR